MKTDMQVTSKLGSYKFLFCNVTNGADVSPLEMGTNKMLCNKPRFCYLEIPDQ